MDENRPNSK